MYFISRVITLTSLRPLNQKLKNNTSMKKENKNLTSFADHLDKQYGIRGTVTREKYEEGFEAFKHGIPMKFIFWGRK